MGCVSYSKLAESCRQYVFRALAQYEPYEVSRSKISIYIRFRNLPYGFHQMRISNHPERARYGSKWQLRLDGKATGVRTSSNCFSNVVDMCSNFKKYYSHVGEPRTSPQVDRFLSGVYLNG